VTDGLSFCLLGSRDSTMDHIKTEKHDLTVIFPEQRWLPEFRMTTIFTPMAGNLYRLDDGDLCGRISFGDVFEALPADEKDVIVFQRRVKRAGLKRACYVSPHDMVERPRFVELMKSIEDLGGFAAVDFKGLFLVFLRKACDLDVNLELNRIAGIPKWRRLYVNLKSRLNWLALQQRWKTIIIGDGWPTSYDRLFFLCEPP
jgi:hypothetical protein